MNTVMLQALTRGGSSMTSYTRIPVLYALLCGLAILAVLRTERLVNRIIYRPLRLAMRLTGSCLCAVFLLVLGSGLIPESPLIPWFWYAAMTVFLVLLCALHELLELSRRAESGLLVPVRVRILSAVSIGFIILVMTNGLHRLVFRFTPVNDGSFRNPVFQPLFYVTATWMLVLFVWFNGLLLQRGLRRPARSALLPPLFIPPVLAVLLTVFCFYFFRHPHHLSAQAYVTCIGVLLLAFLEACVSSRLLPVNTRYRKWFTLTDLDVQIIDSAGRPVLKSAQAKELPSGLLERLLDEQTVTEGDTVFHATPVTGGTAVWQEDISRIRQLTAEARKLVKRLQHSNGLLQRETEIRRSAAEKIIRDELYSQLETLLHDKLIRVSTMAHNLRDHPEDLPARSIITLELCAAKRHSNLFFLEQGRTPFTGDELMVYFDELGEIAGYAGIHVRTGPGPRCQLDITAAALLYSCFEETLVWSISRHSSFLYGGLSETDGQLQLDILTELPPDGLAWSQSLDDKLSAAGALTELRSTEDLHGVQIRIRNGGESA